MTQRDTSDHDNLTMQRVSTHMQNRKSSVLASNESKVFRLVIPQDDPAIDEINMKRDILQDGLVQSGCHVLFTIWLPSDGADGVVDMRFPTKKYSPCFFEEKGEALVKRDAYGAYRLHPRSGGRDISKSFYPIIEKELLSPFSLGRLVPYQEHIFGKGMMLRVVEHGMRTIANSLEQVELISPLEYNRIVGLESRQPSPDFYDEPSASGQLSSKCKATIAKGENEKCEFKSSARWDYRQNCVNKELEKAVLKTVAAFLNSKGGELFIGVDDKSNLAACRTCRRIRHKARLSQL